MMALPDAFTLKHRTGGAREEMMRYAFRFAVAAAVFGMISLIAYSVRAFTIDNQSATDAYGNARFADPDEEVQNFGRGSFLFSQSGPSVQFGTPAPFVGTQGGANWAPQPLGPGAFGATR
jgi:hypothetical protein